MDEKWEMRLPGTDLNPRQNFQENKILKTFEFWILS